MHISSIVSFVNRVLVCLACLAVLPPAQALDPRIGLDAYRHDRWGDAEGAPSLIDAMAQTDDGWLWLGTRRTGLYRFDGVRFAAYTTRDGSTLQHPSISALRAGAGNDLWIGHGITGGVSVLRDHRIRHILGPPPPAASSRLHKERTAAPGSQAGPACSGSGAMSRNTSAPSAATTAPAPNT